MSCENDVNYTPASKPKVCEADKRLCNKHHRYLNKLIKG